MGPLGAEEEGEQGLEGDTENVGFFEPGEADECVDADGGAAESDTGPADETGQAEEAER